MGANVNLFLTDEDAFNPWPLIARHEATLARLHRIRAIRRARQPPPWRYYTSRTREGGAK